MKKIEDLGYEIIYVKEEDMGKRDDIYDAEVWCTYSGFDYVDIEKFKNLKYMALTSTGINHVPKDYLVDNNIFLSNNKAGYNIPISESVIMFILEIYKKSQQAFKKQENKIWNMDMSWMELSGKRVGILGTGTIAKSITKRLKGFDVEIWGVNTNGREIEGFDRCFALDSSDEFFKECDIIVGAMPNTSGTEHIVNSKKMNIMKENSILINVGRGNLIDLQALKYYIDKFKGVALDVVEEEPLDQSSYLWDRENVIITSHNTWVSENNKYRLYDGLYENFKSYAEKRVPNNYIKDIKRGY
ncbi:NAD(P)-dependent oxidoreductase [Peptostreptococcus sp.]|uniref:NAD(P)-dependent oxidoreductase n=1 Tax=Peptostreptococcus sp. TaxID=1262 RepID=UPI002FC6F852